MDRRSSYLPPFWLTLLLWLGFTLQTHADCDPWLGRITSAQGQVGIQRRGSVKWETARADTILCSNDKIRTGERSRAQILLNNRTLLRLDQKTTLSFVQTEEKPVSWLELLQGAFYSISRVPQSLEIKTPFVNAAIKGTEFLVQVGDGESRISVFEGSIQASNAAGSLLIGKGQTLLAQAGKAPVLTLPVDPEDAVQWAIYYPPVSDFSMLAAGAPAPIQKAHELYRQGRLPEAFASLEQVPAAARNRAFYNLRAGLLLAVGRVDEARLDLNQTLLKDPGDSTALALSAVIAVAKNHNDQALELADASIDSAPSAAAPRLAKSYALQAGFDLPAALASAEQALTLAPDSAIALQRVAELQLALGRRDESIALAQRATDLDAGSERAQTLLGFAHLSQLEIDAARSAFTAALRLNGADPLPHLGLGLTRIRQGELQPGIEELEIAATLDPNNAVIRSYLGKAYYEQRNDRIAAIELAMAKELDPQDPTPWFYDAIRKQTENRPVEALQDINQAIRLNDNRAVYRSRLMLDQDASARTANLARIYQDLDFDRLALTEAWKSSHLDWSNHSAHRFLADIYRNTPRLRITRASELLQSQLQQSANITPIQPQLVGSNLAILDSAGPSALSANEYNPLFTRNGGNLQLNGVLGANDTRANNAIASGIYNRFSGSLGQFHYQTDGFRKNDGLKRDLYTAFAQFALSPRWNLQAELTTDDTEAGDVSLRSNGFHQENLHQNIEQDTVRVGARFQPSQRQQWLFSGFYTNFKEDEENLIDNIQLAPNTFVFERNHRHSHLQGYQYEIQHSWRGERFDTTTGFGYIDLDDEQSFNAITRLKQLPDFNLPGLNQRIDSDANRELLNSYFYLRYRLMPQLTSILGFSFDSYEDHFIDRSQLNPKLGLIWSPVDRLTLRGAMFRTLKRPLVANQTVEPTHVAGFNQFYDDNDGARSWRYGFGLDYTVSETLFSGFEVSWRDTDQPIHTSDGPAFNQGRDEMAHLAYLYWTSSERTSLSIEYRYDEFRRDFIDSNGDESFARSVMTHRLPVGLNYFHPNGLFTKLSAIYINQDVRFVSDIEGLNTFRDDFWLFDAEIGYRLPKRYGLLSLKVRNIFNKDFRYHSAFDAGGPQISDLVPEQEAFLSLSLNF